MVNIMTRWAIAAVSIVLLSLSSVIQAQRTTTITTTETRTTTSVISVTSNFVCAKLVNVTGPCRRRRGFPIDEPVILTFDDELDDSIDETFHRVLHPQFVPTRTLGVEVTPLVLLPVVPDTYLPNPVLPAPSVQAVQPSQYYAGRNKAYDPPKPRIYFAELSAFFSSIRANLLSPTISITVTVTNVFTQTTSTLIVSTTSFFVMSCTPSPFPYMTCPAKRSLNIATTTPDDI